MSVKPYFWPKNTHDIKPDKLEATTESDKPEAPWPTPEVPQKPTKYAKPTVKRG